MQQQSGPKTASKQGLIGFFDILGFKNVNKFNSVRRAEALLETILETVKKSESAIKTVESLVNQNFADHVLFSDSILVYTELQSRAKSKLHIEMFVNHCIGLMNSLLFAGFPIRGAISVGPYSVHTEARYMVIAGKAIIEAHELSEAIQLAGCVISPTAERCFATNKDAFLYKVPLKGSSQEMMILNNYAPAWHNRNWSRTAIARKFSDHKKPLDLDVIPKFNNTIAFLEECKRRNMQVMEKFTRCS